MADNQCSAGIRPFPNDTEIRCDGPRGHSTHEGEVHDYAYPGSVTRVAWDDADRRCFYGDWPGPCEKIEGCICPAGHGGRCAV